MNQILGWIIVISVLVLFWWAIKNGLSKKHEKI